MASARRSKPKKTIDKTAHKCWQRLVDLWTTLLMRPISQRSKYRELRRILMKTVIQNTMMPQISRKILQNLRSGQMPKLLFIRTIRTSTVKSRSFRMLRLMKKRSGRPERRRTWQGRSLRRASTSSRKRTQTTKGWRRSEIRSRTSFSSLSKARWSVFQIKWKKWWTSFKSNNAWYPIFATRLLGGPLRT